MKTRKIEIHDGNGYICTTTQSKTLKEAKEKFLKNPTWAGVGPNRKIEGEIKARFKA